MRAGRSARAQTTPELVEASPDCTPCVTTGRSAARLIAGLAKLPITPADTVADVLFRKRRRVSEGARTIVGRVMIRIAPSRFLGLNHFGREF
jgi:hypothetical protein